MREPRPLLGLPDEVKKASPATKMIYLWLKPRGMVDWSASEIAEAVGITKKSAVVARQKLRELNLIAALEPVEERQRSRYYVR
jgi:hypothetical protein